MRLPIVCYNYLFSVICSLFSFPYLCRRRDSLYSRGGKGFPPFSSGKSPGRKPVSYSQNLIVYGFFYYCARMSFIAKKRNLIAPSRNLIAHKSNLIAPKLTTSSRLFFFFSQLKKFSSRKILLSSRKFFLSPHSLALCPR